MAGPATSLLEAGAATADDGVGAPSMMPPPPTPFPLCLLCCCCLLAAATAARSPSSALGTGGAEPGEAIFLFLGRGGEGGERNEKLFSLSFLFGDLCFGAMSAFFR